MANTSVGSKDLATEMLFTHSSKLLTDSSFQNDLTSKLACPHVWFCFVLCFLFFFFFLNVPIVLHLLTLYTKLSVIGMGVLGEMFSCVQ